MLETLSVSVAVAVSLLLYFTNCYCDVGLEPWKTATAYLLNDTSLTASFKPSPAATVCRTCCSVACCPPGNASCGAVNSGGLERDGIASYYLMLRWVATNDSVWLDVAERVIDAWSATLIGFTGHDQMLAVGLYGGHMAQAAELLSYAKPDWAGKSRAQAMFREVFHPGCSQFCGRTNTGWLVITLSTTPRIHSGFFWLT